MSDTAPVGRAGGRGYRPADLPALTDALVAVAATPGPYPPPEAGATAASLTAWLSSGTPLTRWVALAGDRVVGHVQITVAYPYLTGHLAAAGLRIPDLEVGRLFVCPSAQGSGAGRALLDFALAWVRDQGLSCGLAVIDGSPAAEALYRRAGMRPAGSFLGVHGLNHVYVSA